MKRLRLQTVENASRLEGQTQNRYAPAYSYGWSEHLCHLSAAWEEMEEKLRERWSQVPGNPGMSWDEAREAIRDGWEHVSPSKH